jgi:chemotaxis protein CheD
VAIVIYDKRARVGSLAHCLLPDPSCVIRSDNPAKFPSEIVPIMLKELRGMGSSGRGSLVAKLVGGASMFRSLMTTPAMNVGPRNVAAARAALKKARIPIAAEDVGGETGRSIRYSLEDGSVVVRTVRGGQRVL